jgi:hypothetical protein
VGDGLVGVGRDSGLKLLQEICQGLALFTRVDAADSLEVQSESALRQVSAENLKDRRTGQNGEVGPDREVGLFPAKQPAGPAVRARPGDITAEVQRQTGLEGAARLEQNLDRSRSRQIPAQEQSGLGTW